VRYAHTRRRCGRHRAARRPRRRVRSPRARWSRLGNEGGKPRGLPRSLSRGLPQSARLSQHLGGRWGELPRIGPGNRRRSGEVRELRRVRRVLPRPIRRGSRTPMDHRRFPTAIHHGARSRPRASASSCGRGRPPARSARTPSATRRASPAVRTCRSRPRPAPRCPACRGGDDLRRLLPSCVGVGDLDPDGRGIRGQGRGAAPGSGRVPPARPRRT
jgi:hypothetical protein